MHPSAQDVSAKEGPPLSQQGLAELLGVDRVTVARWETGKRKMDEERLLSVSKKTGIPVAKLRPDLASLLREPTQ